MLAALLLTGCLIQTPTPSASPNEPQTSQGIATSTRPATQPGALPTATAVFAPTLSPTSVGIAATTLPLATPTPMFVTFEGRQYKRYAQPPLMTIDPNATYTAIFRTNLGEFTVELFVSQTPLTVNSFVFLAQEGFYNGLMFHRVIPDFMIQGGDPTGTGFEGPGYQYRDEIVSGVGFDGPGILAMANSGANTNGSQFFITLAPTPHLDGRHTIFGRITSGQAVVDAISLVTVGPRDRPAQPVVIQALEIRQTSG